MIKHFPNFVCWREIFDLYDEKRDTLYLDSISCFFMGLLLGIRGSYFPGPEMALSLSKEPLGSLYFLLSDEIKDIDKEKKLILPFKESFNDDKEVLDFVRAIPENGKVVIGVSSPKQNILACYLFSIRPDLEYYCLGAAVKHTWGFKSAKTQLIGTGFQWIEFLVFQPKRTIVKQLKTLSEMISIFCSSKKIKNYREFVKLTKLKHS